MRRLGTRIVITIGLVIPALYILTFTVWWLRCPRVTYVVQGQTVRVVESHGNSLPLDGEFLWYPAFWAVQHVCGYHPVGFAPTTDGDIVFWVRNPPAEWRLK